MTNRTVLLLPGDGSGNNAIKSLPKLINILAPDAEILMGDIGFSAYSTRGEVLPERTMDLLSICDGVVCGFIDEEKLEQRNPLDDLSVQFGLRTVVEEYFALPHINKSPDLDTLLMGPNPDLLPESVENEELSNITSTTTLERESIRDLMFDAKVQADLHGCRNISFVPGYQGQPLMTRFIQEQIPTIASEYCIDYDIIGERQATTGLLTDTESFECIVCGRDSMSYIEGITSGMCGGYGLMPRGLIGDRYNIFTPSYCTDEGRINNPTSVVLSAGLMLLNIGERKAYEAIRETVKVMYHEKWTTADVGGCLNANQFMDGVCKLAEAYIKYT